MEGLGFRQRPGARSRARRPLGSISGWLLLAGALPWLARPLPAQEVGPAAQQRQIVFVIDDSGSMSDGAGAPDPDRLAVFAVRALVGVLGESDWVSILRLNGPLDGEPPMALAPLTPGHHQKAGEILDLAGLLARYGGQHTPCRSALERARDLLNTADAADKSQIVILLSDGECNPAVEQPPANFLTGLRSHQADEGRFQLYLLRFEGTEATPQLARLAEESGGAAVDVRRGDPTRILYAFAGALSRSQGTEAKILTPANRSLPAYRGADRVRLLAVARGGGPDLAIRVRDGKGGEVAVSRLDQGRHRFGGGREYRFAAAEYQPGGAPVEALVEGAGNDWEMVVLPDFRLVVKLDLTEGGCAAGGPLIGHSVLAGSYVCARIRLTNQRGEAVGREVSSGALSASLDMEPGAAGVAANPAGATDFFLELPALTEGHHTLRARIHLTAPEFSDRPRSFVAPLRTFQVISSRIVAEPATLDFGVLDPGGRRGQELRLTGDLPSTQGHAELTDPGLPASVELTFGGHPLGAPLAILPDHPPYPVELRVADDCCRSGRYQSALVLRTEGGQPLKEIPLVVEVASSWWRCWRRTILACLLALLGLLAIAYLIGMVRHSSFLDRRQLETRLVPLHWPRSGEAPKPALNREVDRDAVADMLRTQLSFKERAINWLKANPLDFGLPGRRFVETLELMLFPDLDTSSVALVAEKDIVGRLQDLRPDLDGADEGRLFARAGGGVTFVAVRGPKGKIGPLVLRNAGRSAALEVETIAPGQQLVSPAAPGQRREGAVAGWMLE